MLEVKRTAKGNRVKLKKRARVGTKVGTSLDRLAKKDSAYALAVTKARKARIIAAAKNKKKYQAIWPDIDINLGLDKADRVQVRRLRFGAVTVSNTVPDMHTLIVNVRAGRDAMIRARDAFTTPGVTLQHRGHVPRFRVDARNPGVLIREVNGRTDRGRIVNGSFVPAE